MQIPIISGIYGKTSADVVRSYPINLQPLADTQGGEGTGISAGYLRLIPGVTTKATTGAQDRGGYNWNGRHIRAVGTSLMEVAGDGTVSVLGFIQGGGPVTFAQSFDRLAVAAGRMLYYLQGATVTPVTDTDLGAVLSLAWSDGYFITTDGTSIVVTELSNPTSVDPLKYGSSEADPDPITGVLALRGTVYALNRYTIEAFDNRGTTGFPFSRSRGSQIPKGCVGPQAFTPFVETFAFVGSARNEAPGVFLAGAGQAIPIAPRQLADELGALTEAQLAAIELETLNNGGQLQLLIHLPAKTWVYHWTASQAFDVPVWTILAGGVMTDVAYPARHFVYVGTDWWCGGATKLGVVSAATTIFDQPFGFRFDTQLIYNAGAPAVVDQLELVTLGGRESTTTPSVMLSYSDDGLTWGQERTAKLGARGNRGARPVWRRLGRIRNWRSFRFRGVAQAPVAFLRLEAQVEPLDA